jgi:hypothetical protein
MLKNLLKYVFDKMGYIVLKKGLPAEIRDDDEFVSILNRCKAYTMVSSERSYALYKAVEYLVRCKIPGDMVECGVWKGGQAMLVAYKLLQEGEKSRTLWLYDTFAGMTQPSQDDVDSHGKKDSMEIWEKSNRGEYNEWCYAPIDEVKRNLRATGYPQEYTQFVKGKVEETIPATIPDKIALLRLDTDWYESTRHELEHLYPRLVEGGVLFIDDYGSWKGSRKAVDEYLREQGAKVLLIKAGEGRIGVKVH